jgi:uncharacterized protein YodC (DUF2158 family)
MDLKPGDVVTLKSGGHPLTVVEVKEDEVACLWMGGEGDDLFRETLPLAVLERAEHDEDHEDEDDEEEDDEDEDDEKDDEEKSRKKK